jgi:hypothetical protein
VKPLDWRRRYFCSRDRRIVKARGSCCAFGSARPAPPTVQRPFRMIVKPLQSDELTLHDAGRRTRYIDGRLHLAADFRCNSKTDD